MKDPLRAGAATNVCDAPVRRSTAITLPVVGSRGFGQDSAATLPSRLAVMALADVVHSVTGASPSPRRTARVDCPSFQIATRPTRVTPVLATADRSRTRSASHSYAFNAAPVEHTNATGCPIALKKGGGSTGNAVPAEPVQSRVLRRVSKRMIVDPPGGAHESNSSPTKRKLASKYEVRTEKTSLAASVSVPVRRSRRLNVTGKELFAGAGNDVRRNRLRSRLTSWKVFTPESRAGVSFPFARSILRTIESPVPGDAGSRSKRNAPPGPTRIELNGPRATRKAGLTSRVANDCDDGLQLDWIETENQPGASVIAPANGVEDGQAVIASELAWSLPVARASRVPSIAT